MLPGGARPPSFVLCTCYTLRVALSRCFCLSFSQSSPWLCEAPTKEKGKEVLCDTTCPSHLWPKEPSGVSSHKATDRQEWHDDHTVPMWRLMWTTVPKPASGLWEPRVTQALSFWDFFNQLTRTKLGAPVSRTTFPGPVEEQFISPHHTGYFCHIQVAWLDSRHSQLSLHSKPRATPTMIPYHTTHMARRPSEPM